MIALTQIELDCVRSILRDVVPEVRVLAFGSRVRGSARRYSDLDLALITEEPLPLSTIGALREAFSQSDLPFLTDIVDSSVISPEFRAIILREGEPLSGSASG